MATFPQLIKRLDGKVYALVISLVIVGGVLFRLFLIARGWPMTNSDEAVMDLMAKHINELGEHPTFFYGQYYMGTMEAYVGAVFFRLFGASLFMMRFTSIIYYAGFLICIYLVAKRLYHKGAAFLTLLFLVGGSLHVVIVQLRTIGGYPELPFITSLFFLISFHLADTYRQTRWRSRVCWYVLWGLLVGLALWTHQVVLPYVLVSGLLLVICCPREFFKWGVWAAFVSMLIGAWPLINYNLHPVPGQDSLSVLAGLSQAGRGFSTTLVQQLQGTFFISLPVQLGFEDPCFVTNSSLQPSSPCLPQQIALGSVSFFLFLLASVLAIIALVSMRRRQTILQHEKSRQWGRLGLALAALLTILIYAKSPSGNTSPVLNVRYLHLLLVSIPIVFGLCWDGIGGLQKCVRSIQLRRYFFLLHGGLILIVCLLTVRSIVWITNDIPAVDHGYQKLVQLSDHLEDQGITRFYSEYWTCNVLIFISQERLICAVTNDYITEGVNRYTPYREAVIHSSKPVYVYRKENYTAIATLEEFLRGNGILYKSDIFGDYVIYQPIFPDQTR